MPSQRLRNQNPPSPEVSKQSPKIAFFLLKSIVRGRVLNLNLSQSKIFTENRPYITDIFSIT